MYFYNPNFTYAETEVHRGEGLIKEVVYRCLAPGHQHTTPYIVIDYRQEEDHRKDTCVKKNKSQCSVRGTELEGLHVQLWSPAADPNSCTFTRY